MSRDNRPDSADVPTSGHSPELTKRVPLERMLRIHRAISSGKFPNAVSLAREMEISEKTVHRDLDFMRDRLGLPIEWDYLRKGFHYTEEVTAFPTLHVTEGELVALLVAEKALHQYRGTLFEKPLLSAIRKMEQSLPDTISLSMAEIDQTFSFSTRAEPVLNMEILETLSKAATARKQVEIQYRKPGQKQVEQRIIDPYHLANINGEWFLFAYDHLRSDIRTFVPARIQAIHQTGRTFEKSSSFSLEQRLRGSFGVHSGTGQYDVVIRFNGRVADYIREKKWHDSQKLRELKDGGIELSLKLTGLSEVERWVLSWGGDASVVKPIELANSVKEAAKRILNPRGG